MQYAGAKGNDIHELASNFKGTTMTFFKDMYEDIRVSNGVGSVKRYYVLTPVSTSTQTDTAKQSGLSADGTVHELTSTVSKPFTSSSLLPFVPQI